MLMLLYSEHTGEMSLSTLEKTQLVSSVWPTVVSVGGLANVEALRSEVEEHLRATVDEDLAADQGVVLAPESYVGITQAVAAERAIERSFADLRKWSDDVQKPVITGTWEGAHAWAFLVAPGHMNSHGAVVDKYTGRCFLRMYGQFAEVFGL